MADTYFDFPMHINGRGRTAVTDADNHVRDLIHQVLFTAPGERVNRPVFGCGLKQLVFLPNSDALAASTQQLVQGALLRWLEDVIVVEAVTVETINSSLEVTVIYTRRETGTRHQDVFVREAVQ
jgi:phage baseplate assembly protein W